MADILDGVIRISADTESAQSEIAKLTDQLKQTEAAGAKTAQSMATNMGSMSDVAKKTATTLRQSVSESNRAINSLQKAAAVTEGGSALSPQQFTAAKGAIDSFAQSIKTTDRDIKALRATLQSADVEGSRAFETAKKTALNDIAAAEARLAQARQTLESTKRNLRVGGSAADANLNLNQAQQEVREMKAQLGELTNSVRTFGTEANRSARQAGRAFDQTNRDVSRVLTTLRNEALVARGGRAAVLEQQARDVGLTTDQIAPYMRAIRGLDGANVKAALSQRQLNQAMRLLPAQITDIVTSLVSGQPAYLVAIQQGGQLKDSFGGIGNAAKVLANLVTPRLLGLTALGSAAIGLGVGLVKASNDASSLNRALILTNNIAGQTSGSLRSLASQLGDAPGSNVTVGEAQDILTQLVATGKLTSEQFALMTRAAQAYSKATDVATEEVVANFAKLANDPLKELVKLNEGTNFLTASIYDQIKALEDRGDSQEAARVAIQAYSDFAIDANQRIVDSMDPLERRIFATGRLWEDLKDILATPFRFAFEAPEQELERLKRAREEAGRELGETSGLFFSGGNQRRADARERELQAQVDAAQKTAALEGLQIQNNRILVQAKTEISKQSDAAEKSARRLTFETNNYLKLVEKIRAADPNSPDVQEATVQKNLALLREAYKNRADKATKTATNEAITLLETLKKQNVAREFDTKLQEVQARIQQIRDKGESKISDSLEQQLLTQARIADSITRTNKLKEDAVKYSGDIAKANERIAQQDENRTMSFEAANREAERYIEAAKRSSSEEIASFSRTDRANEQVSRLLDIERDFLRDRDRLRDQFERGTDRKALDRQVSQARERIAELQTSLQQAFESGSSQSSINLFGDQLKAAREYYSEIESLRQEQISKSQIGYEKELELLLASKDEMIRIELETQQQLQRIREDGAAGAKKAVADYVEEGTNFFELYEQGTRDVLGNIEDAFAQLASTGKLSIDDLEKAVIASLSRIAAKIITANLTQLVGSFFTAGLGAGAGASAGASASQTYTYPSGVPLASGMDYVPYDNFPARLHKGERVMTAEENKTYSKEPAVMLSMTINGVKDEGDLRRSASQVARAASRAVSAGRRNG